MNSTVSSSLLLVASQFKLLCLTLKLSNQGLVWRHFYQPKPSSVQVVIIILSSVDFYYNIAYIYWVIFTRGEVWSAFFLSYWKLLKSPHFHSLNQFGELLLFVVEGRVENYFLNISILTVPAALMSRYLLTFYHSKIARPSVYVQCHVLLSICLESLWLNVYRT